MTLTDQQRIATDPVRWADEHGEFFAYYGRLDNYEPPRDTATGAGWSYIVEHSGDVGYILRDVSDLPDARKALYILTDSRAKTTKVCYVASYREGDDWLIVHEMPTYENWNVGPRRAYHFQITWAEGSNDATT